MNIAEEKNLEKIVEDKQLALKTDKLDMSFGELANYYKDENLIIQPEYQRLFRWKEEQKSRFIESLLLGLPIPSIFISENKEGKWELVDGLQRVSTVISFMGLMEKEQEIEDNTQIQEEDETINEDDLASTKITNKNNWKLQGCSVITELNGKGFNDLPFKVQFLIRRYPCRMEILRSNTSSVETKYELFDRLNTGGSKATEQEIRNCIFRGEKYSQDFYKLLEKLSKDDNFIKLVNLPAKKINELYDQELVLRFFSFLHFNQIDKKDLNENLAPSMTKYMKEIVKGEITFDYTKKRELFFRTIKIIKLINEKLSNSLLKGSNNNFSSNSYDIVMLGIALNIEYYENNWENTISKISENKSELLKIKLSGGSGNSTAIKKRIELADSLFKPER
jgi:Protein of unknown function DUF262